jgi:FlaA1/EpsC-like NDP-sugar epimerase
VYLIGLRGSIAIVRSVAYAGTAAFLLNLLYWELAGGMRIPIGVMLGHPVLVAGGFLGARYVRRAIWCRGRGQSQSQGDGARRVLIAGAGQAGLALVQELLSRKDYKVVGFVDDNPQLIGRMIEGRPVLGKTGLVASLVRKHSVDEVVLCMPGAPRAALARIGRACRESGVSVSTVPPLSEVLGGRFSISHLRDVSMAELLGRFRVDSSGENRLSVTAYRNRRILVTGAAGSIGSELVRQCIEFGPAHLVLLDKSENGLFELGLEIREQFSQFTEVIADIRDSAALERIFERFRPEVVFHAAAFKHVPLMEDHPGEAILNNVFGTKNLIETAGRFGAANFVLISTDKAVNPSSIMGASKRVAEMLIQQAAMGKPDTRFCCVRFGNVLGSRASVVTIFQKQIREGKPITITHPEMRRYFMTIPEAVQLVMQAGAMGDTGEIFVLEMGEQVNISDLARNLIKLYGLVPDRDVRIVYTGLRSGEKLSEQLALENERLFKKTENSRIFVARPGRLDTERLELVLPELRAAALAADGAGIRHCLHELEIGYRAGASEPARVRTAGSSV